MKQFTFRFINGFCLIGGLLVASPFLLLYSAKHTMQGWDSSLSVRRNLERGFF
jgi:hypothetical protein